MKKEQMAQFLGDMNDQLIARFEHWIIAGHGSDERDRKAVDWVCQENRAAIIELRRGGSYEDVSESRLTPGQR
jgi:hypothetical protein